MCDEVHTPRGSFILASVASLLSLPRHVADPTFFSMGCESGLERKKDVPKPVVTKLPEPHASTEMNPTHAKREKHACSDEDPVQHQLSRKI